MHVNRGRRAVARRGSEPYNAQVRRFLVTLCCATPALSACARDFPSESEAVSSPVRSQIANESADRWQVTIVDSTRQLPLGPSQQYVIDVNRATDSRTSVDVEHWTIRARGDTRLYTKRVELGADENAALLLSDGGHRSLPLRGPAPTAYRPLPATLKLRPFDPFTSRTRQKPAGAARIQRQSAIITTHEGAVRLRTLRDSFPNVSRRSASQLVFTGERKGDRVHIVFDESIGAEVESELVDRNGSTISTQLTYAPEGSNHRLIRRETLVSNSGRTRRFIETFGTGGVR
jgi:hypothetical protein